MAQPVRIIGHDKDGVLNEHLQAQVGTNGSLQVNQEGFKCSDMDTSSDPSYYGFVDKDGRWYILRLNESTGQLRFVAGDASYALNYSNRASLSYDYYHNVF